LKEHTSSASLKISPKNTFLLLEFQNEQPLDKQFFQIVDRDGKNISFSLSYVTESSRSQEKNNYIEQVNKHKVKIILKSPIQREQVGLKLIIKQGLDNFLKEDYEI
jgi:hypothetical protein